MKRLLLTGAGGFVGSHVLEHVLLNTDWEVVCIDSWAHKGVPERIVDSESYKLNRDRVTILTHDLSAPLNGSTIEKIGHVDYIWNLASDSHVDRSIEDPVPFVENNVSLALNMLELARKIKPELFIQFSTDEVYGAAPLGHNHKEWEAILPSNPYSASKAAQEAIAVSYWRTYGVPVVITNTMNVFGERQDKEKYLAMVISKVHKGEKLTVHGDKDFIGSRYYIHARNVADALLFLSKKAPTMYEDGKVDRPDRYNIVGEREIDNLEIAQMIAEVMGKGLDYELEDFHKSRPGHDRRYALDGGKLKEEGWEPPVNFKESLKNYVNWTLDNPEWL